MRGDGGVGDARSLRRRIVGRIRRGDETIDAVDVVVDASAHDDVFDAGATLNASGLSCKDQGRWAEAAQRFERAVAHGAARMRAAERAGDARAWRDACRRRRPRVCVTSARFARVRVAWATPPPRFIAR